MKWIETAERGGKWKSLREQQTLPTPGCNRRQCGRDVQAILGDDVTTEARCPDAIAMLGAAFDRHQAPTVREAPVDEHLSIARGPPLLELVDRLEFHTRAGRAVRGELGDARDLEVRL